MIGAAGMAMAIPVVIWGWSMWAGILLAFAALFGYLNGHPVVRTGLPSFIVTLASLFVLRGATLGFTRWITSRTRISGLHAHAQGDPLAVLFSGHPLEVPLDLVVDPRSPSWLASCCLRPPSVAESSG